MPADSHDLPMSSADAHGGEEHDCEFCSPPLIPIPAPWDRPGAEDPATWGSEEEKEKEDS
jgi:hypothetical protein